MMNLSYGTGSTQEAKIDRLSLAVDQAWRRGIVVVAATDCSAEAVPPRHPPSSLVATLLFQQNPSITPQSVK